MLTFLGGLLAGAAALLYTLHVPSNVVLRRIHPRHQGVLCGRARRHRQMSAARSDRRTATRVMENYGSVVFGNQWKDVVAFAAADPGADVPADGHPR